MLGYAKYAALGLGSLLFLFFVTRHLRRRERSDLIGEPVWLRQIDSPRALAELTAAGGGGAHGSEPLLTNNPNRRRQQIEQAVNREPDRVVQALRAWMAEDEG
jgi:flagellar M-ring protein FliF